MEETKNMEKYEAYRSMMVNLTKALKSGFYYEAIFIEYAIIEDRCLSVLLSAGVKVLDKRGNVIKLSTKLNKLRTHKAFVVPFMRKKLPSERSFPLIFLKRSRIGSVTETDLSIVLRIFLTTLSQSRVLQNTAKRSSDNLTTR